MLHPNQFKVNDAWVAFGLNDVPVPTREDGELRFVALMDAASCFLLAAVPSSFASPLSREEEARELFRQAWVHKEISPRQLFVVEEERYAILEMVATEIGISIMCVPSKELAVFIKEAKVGFAEHFGLGKSKHQPGRRKISASRILKARKRVKPN